MKILYCCWNENSTEDAIYNLKLVADEVVCIKKSVKEYLDGRVIADIGKHLGAVDYVFSHDFFPIISEMCKAQSITYISVVYDWPNYTMFNPAVYNSCNRIYLFDRDAIGLLERYRVNNINYMPLSVDVARLDKMLGEDVSNIQYSYDVSFVGNMYLKKEEALMTGKIPAYYSGFADALVNAQQQVYGYNLINEIVDKDFTKKYLDKIQGKIDGAGVPDEFVLATQINRLVTGCERRYLLKLAANQFNVDLFTQSSAEGLGNVRVHGGVDYSSEMPRVFRQSKINLNITLRSITSGIPLRVFDILGAGGFCLTNYQESILEHFEDGRDLVIFSSPEDMLDKIEYYLTHEDERMAIARNGHEKVKKYSYYNTYKKILMDRIEA